MPGTSFMTRVPYCNLPKERNAQWPTRKETESGLRQFVTHLKKNWMLKETKTFPVFTPVQKFAIKKNSKSYENWCKLTLLAEKPGCYITNVGNDFESFEEELKHFVQHSEFCPQLIKQEYEESQLEFEEDIPEDEDQLLISPLQNPGDEGILTNDLQTYQLNEPAEANIEINDDINSNYDADEFVNDHLTYDWESDRNTLLESMTEAELQCAKDWIKDKKIHTCPKNLIMRISIPIHVIKLKKISTKLFVTGSKKRKLTQTMMQYVQFCWEGLAVVNLLL